MKFIQYALVIILVGVGIMFGVKICSKGNAEIIDHTIENALESEMPEELSFKEEESGENAEIVEEPIDTLQKKLAEIFNNFSMREDEFNSWKQKVLEVVSNSSAKIITHGGKHLGTISSYMNQRLEQIKSHNFLFYVKKENEIVQLTLGSSDFLDNVCQDTIKMKSDIEQLIDEYYAQLEYLTMDLKGSKKAFESDVVQNAIQDLIFFFESEDKKVEISSSHSEGKTVSIPVRKYFEELYKKGYDEIKISLYEEVQIMSFEYDDDNDSYRAIVKIVQEYVAYEQENPPTDAFRKYEKYSDITSKLIEVFFKKEDCYDENNDLIPKGCCIVRFGNITVESPAKEHPESIQ
jgi:hypothetical protein